MILILILVLLILILLAVGYAAFFVACVRIPTEPDLDKSKYLRPYKDQILSGAQWFRDRNPELVQVRRSDALRLAGYLLPVENAKGTLVLVHGYRGTPFTDFGYSLPFYGSLGWNILAICQRSHGESEGKYITFGVRERYDLRDWVLYLNDRFGPEKPIVPIGISMGASTVLMSLGTGLPSNVKCAIADCGFTSPYEEFCHVLKTRHIPRRPILDIADLFARIFARFGFKEYSTIDALKYSHIPVTFVHGQKDHLVPLQFTVDNYAACAGEKRLITVPDAGHGTSYVFATDECQQAIRDWLWAHAY